MRAGRVLVGVNGSRGGRRGVAAVPFGFAQGKLFGTGYRRCLPIPQVNRCYWQSLLRGISPPALHLRASYWGFLLFLFFFNSPVFLILASFLPDKFNGSDHHQYRAPSPELFGVAYLDALIRCPSVPHSHGEVAGAVSFLGLGTTHIQALQFPP